MDEITINSAQTYTLPLECFELSYLTKYMQNRNEERNLWPKSRLDGETEYYQIKIVTEDINDNDCYLEPLQTYTCHICDIDVPKIFFNKHNESKKHKTYKNICEKFLQRISKQINLNLINDKNDISGIYYCVPCSKAIKLKNKYKHESSDYHTKSLNNTETLNDFLKIFMQNENSNVAYETENSDIVNNNLECNNANREQDSSLDSDDDIFNSESGDETVESDSIEKENMKGILKPSNINGQENSFESYLKEMIVKYKLNFNIPYIDGDYIYVEAANEEKCKISRQQFHSYKKDIKDWINCQMCRTLISQDTTAHETTEMHVRNILKPVDEEFSRKIHQDWSHCLPCNESFVPSFNHIHTKNHEEALNRSKIPQNIQNKKIVTNGKTLCEICNINIDSHNFVSHINSKKHKNKEISFLEQEKISLINNDEYFCVLCNVLFAVNSLHSHIDSTKHVVKRTESLAAEHPEFCDLCNVNVPRGGMEAHTADNLHNNKLLHKLCIDLKNEIQALKEDHFAKQADSRQTNISPVNNNPVTDTSDNSTSNNDSSDDEDIIDSYYKLLLHTNTAAVKCKVCNVNINNVKQNIIQHMEGKQHEDQVKYNEYLKLMRYTDNTKKEIECRVCDVIVPFVQHNVIEHVEGRWHRQDENELLSYHKIKKISKDYFCQCCSCYVTSFFDHINNDEHIIVYQKKYIIDKRLVRRFVYENDEKNCEAIMYRELYKNLLRVNKIAKLHDTKFYCEICAINMGRFSEIDHMLGERHRLLHPNLSS